MPISIRKKGKASLIAISLLGSPINKEKKSKKKNKKEQQLEFEETRRV